MTAFNPNEIALYCASGLVQYSESVLSMLDEYNRRGRFYTIRAAEDGSLVLWHKGHRRAVGTFKPSTRPVTTR